MGRERSSGPLLKLLFPAVGGAEVDDPAAADVGADPQRHLPRLVNLLARQHGGGEDGAAGCIRLAAGEEVQRTLRSRLGEEAADDCAAMLFADTVKKEEYKAA